MAVEPTITIEFELVEGGGTYSSGYSSDVLYPISFKYGFNNNKPTAPHVAGVGTGQFYFNNLDTDYPYSEPSSDGNVRGKGINTRYRILIDYDSDTYSTFSFYGRVVEWNVVPGLADERVTEVILNDYMGDLYTYNVENLGVRGSITSGDALVIVCDSAIGGNVLPFSPPVHSFSTNGQAFTYVFHDIKDGETKGIKPVMNIAGSEYGHAFSEGNTFYYKTNDDWVALGTSIGTLDNRFLSMDVGKRRGMEFGPIYVTYYPAELADSEYLTWVYPQTVTVAPGDTDIVLVHYLDHTNNKTVQLACLDTDIITPVMGSDLGHDATAGSDAVWTFTNRGSMGEFALGNAGGSSDINWTFVRVRATPVLMYEKATLYSASGNPSAVALTWQMKYQDDRTKAQAFLDWLNTTYNTYPQDNIITSVSFVATADSDSMGLAMQGKIGKEVTIVEDVNIINEAYTITSVEWEILSPQMIIVTWGVWPASFYSTF